MISDSVKTTGVDADMGPTTTTKHDPDIPPHDDAPQLLEPTESQEATTVDFEPTATPEPEQQTTRTPAKTEKLVPTTATPNATRQLTHECNKL